MDNKFTKEMAQSAAITALASMVDSMDIGKTLFDLPDEDRKKLIDKIADDLLESINLVFGPKEVNPTTEVVCGGCRNTYPELDITDRPYRCPHCKAQ